MKIRSPSFFANLFSIYMKGVIYMTDMEQRLMTHWYCNFFDDVYDKEVIYLHKNYERTYYNYEFLSLLTDLLNTGEAFTNKHFGGLFSWFMTCMRDIDDEYVKRLETLFMEYFNDVENFYGIDDRIMKIVTIPIISNKFKCFLLTKMEHKEDNRFEL